MARRRNKKTSCLNCEHQFNSEENYCSQCGQENHDLKIPLKHLLEEFLEGLFHFDNKVWLSLKTLFLYPGSITKEFLAGRRVSFVPPIRLYVFFSFIFFLVLNIYNSEKSKLKDDEKLLDAVERLVKEEDSTAKFTGLDSLEIQLDTSQKISKKERMVLSRIKNLDGKAIKFLNQKFYKYLSFALFLLVPIFAFIMKLVYYRSRKFYYEHLIASIHYHVVVFILMTIMLGAAFIDSPTFVYLLLFLAGFVYFVISLKTVFSQSITRSTLKALIIFMSYGFLLLCMILIIIIYTGYEYLKSA